MDIQVASTEKKKKVKNTKHMEAKQYATKRTKRSFNFTFIVNSFLSFLLSFPSSCSQQ